ncbi:MAG: hypothetical protein UT11_C0015G0006 [Berkelbacteria bacterium GW2011_GWA2_38_9]|uniref:Type II secretion system protein GspG C-terminal domain-containing protein n=1 Tax=Berkelbacteria bacterium GW2011_GWA2_38_9 TaxID=1618334 RepID=A0A0G0NVT8_9BACT|nr:MAG: hypothetical protein UT11_C0015G0006 [Berkelbacteria bacterium GW2011_GWA2_38_9]
MADNDLNQNQPPLAAPTVGYSKIIDPLDEPLEDSQPQHIPAKPTQSVPSISNQPPTTEIKVGNPTSNTFHPLTNAPLSSIASQPPKSLNPSPSPIGNINSSQVHNQSSASPTITNTPKPADVSSPKPQPNPVTPITNPIQSPNTSSISVGQFKLPSEELIAEEKQKIQPVSPLPLSSQNNIENKIGSVPAGLLNQPPTLNQKPILKSSVPPINVAPNKKKRSILKVFLLIILILIVVLGVLVGITYAGIEIPFVSKFISQYLPISHKKDFTKSIANAQDAVSQATFYSVATTINLGESTTSSSASSNSDRAPGTPPALPGVTSSSSVDSQVAWNNMILSVFGTRQADGKMSGTLSIAPANTKGQASIFQVSYDFALDEKLLYLHPLGLFDANSANWQAIDLKEVETNQSLATLLKILDLKQLLPMFESGEWQAQEGVIIKSQSNKDLGTITANKFNISTTNVVSSSIGDLKTILYIAENESHPVKATATASIKDQSGASVPATIKSYFFNYNVEQKVSIPKKADYAMITLDTFLSSNGFYSGSAIPDGTSEEADARDKTRKADIDKLVQALEKYKTDKNTYPITSRIEKTNESGTLKDALVSDYLNSLPVDPLDPNYWYGYNSDGYTYHITAIIEGSDTSAKQGARVKYQEITK